MRAKTRRPFAVTSASSRSIVSFGPRRLARVTNPSALIWHSMLRCARAAPSRRRRLAANELLVRGDDSHAFCGGADYIRGMPTLIAGAVAVVTLYLLLQMFRAANPAVLARAIKIGGGVVALAIAAFTGLRGELAVAIPLGIFGAGLLGWSPLTNSGFPNIDRKSTRL